MKRLLNNYPVASVILLMFICLAPVMAMRDFSPANELRYLSIADEAIADGNVFAFTNQGEPYADKPPLYFWLFMLCRIIFGQHCMFVLSLFSFIPAMVIIVVMDKWLCSSKTSKRFFSSSERAATALLLGTSGLFLGMSVFLRMDMLMVMWMVLALYSFHCDRPAAFAAYTFLALFTKGPVGIMAPLLAVIVFLLVRRRTSELGKWLGWKTLLILLIPSLIWFLGVYIDGGREYLNNLLVHQTVGRAVNSFHHKAPLWYYAVAVWGILAPWSLATVSAAFSSFFTGKGKESEGIWAWYVLSCFVMLSCFSSKIAIYLAPIIPFVAYLFPVIVDRTGYSRWLRLALYVPALLFVLIGIVAVVAGAFWAPVSKLMSSFDVDMSLYSFAHSPLTVISGILFLSGGVAGFMTVSKSWHKAVIAMGISLLLSMFSASWMMPSINDFVGYGNICKEIPEGLDVYTWKVYRPEGMDAYLVRDVVVLDSDLISNSDLESVSRNVPDEAVFITKTNRFPEGIPGRNPVTRGEYTVFLP